MSPRASANQTTGNVGLYWVCYRLSQQGWNVMPTARNAVGVDILAYREGSAQAVTVQVKTLSELNPVPLGSDLGHLFAHFVVVCCLAKAQPECFVLPAPFVRDRATRREKAGTVSYWLQPKEFSEGAFREEWLQIARVLPGAV